MKLIQELTRDIAQLIESPERPIYSEHGIIKSLEASGKYLEFSHAIDTNNSMSALFIKHFLVMHCVYSLREHYKNQKLGFLSVSPLSVQLRPWSETTGSELDVASETDSVSEYYLDLSNLSSESEESIQGMLGEFWKKFSLYECITDEVLSGALETLGLDTVPELSRLKRRYRELASTFHPDKGGSEEAFVKLRGAYECVLVRVHENSNV